MLQQKQNFISLWASYQAEKGYTAHHHARLFSVWIGCGRNMAITWKQQAWDWIGLLTGISYVYYLKNKCRGRYSIHYPDATMVTLVASISFVSLLQYLGSLSRYWFIQLRELVSLQTRAMTWRPCKASTMLILSQYFTPVPAANTQ